MEPVAVNIRLCTPGDEHALALVGQASFLEAFAGSINGADIVHHCLKHHAVEKYAAYLSDARTRVWVAEVEPGRAPVGYLVLTTPDLPVADVSPTDLEVKRIYLLHRFHGLRIGASLMDTARDYARSIGTPRLLLGVYGQNASAIAFYERHGYTRIGTREFQVGGNRYHDLILGLKLQS
jgi:ribosomal protein S18 acetylase RimI-like enzyme